MTNRFPEAPRSGPPARKEMERAGRISHAGELPNGPANENGPRPIERNLGLDLVRVKKVGLDPSEFTRKYDPSSPAADNKGYVKLPNVNALIEMSDMREAQRSYEANLKVVEVARSMLQKTIDILR